MGIFSDMNINDETQNEVVVPFTVEDNQENIMIETFSDDTKQQAEANEAPALLSYLINKSNEGSPTDDTEDDEPVVAELTPAQKKKEHEEQEAKRKAEWDAKQATKQEAEMMAWETAVAVSDDELMNASMKRIGTDSERLTRRNMKICVTEHIQTKCLEDMSFARQTLHPRKNMINCFKYINRKALEFVKQEMEDNETKADGEGYGSDVPDDLCYKWAEDYFLDLDAEEDKGKEEKYVAKTYSGPAVPKGKKTAKKAEKKVVPPPKTEAIEQTSLVEQAVAIVQPTLMEQASLIGGQ